MGWKAPFYHYYFIIGWLLPTSGKKLGITNWWLWKKSKLSARQSSHDPQVTSLKSVYFHIQLLELISLAMKGRLLFANLPKLQLYSFTVFCFLLVVTLGSNFVKKVFSRYWKVWDNTRGWFQSDSNSIYLCVHLAKLAIYVKPTLRIC